jgi:hypothetical protein
MMVPMMMLLLLDPRNMFILVLIHVILLVIDPKLVISQSPLGSVYFWAAIFLLLAVIVAIYFDAL